MRRNEGRKCNHTEVKEDSQRKFYDDKYKTWEKGKFTPLYIDTSKKIINLLKIKKGDLVLDLGCGDGRLSNFVSKLSNCTIVGIDISEVGIKKARESSSNMFLISDVRYLPFKHGVFDNIYGFAVLHHFSSTNVVLKEAYNAMKPNSFFVSVDPNKPLARKILNPFISKVISPGEKQFTKNDLITLFQKTRFEILEIGPFFMFLSLIKPIFRRLPFDCPEALYRILASFDKILIKIKKLHVFSWSIYTLSKKIKT